MRIPENKKKSQISNLKLQTNFKFQFSMTETFMPVESRRIDDTILQEMAPLDIAEDRSSVGLLVSIWP
ncbi:hypothetical protein D1AOALGA4SA_3516 [Olavius algarvensis Delta 1 endosymbiont]|nr:hypothetical protein D1AOALGA4SA_3516 [Olavius algarvensis Delta 1 endosymbiont]